MSTTNTFLEQKVNSKRNKTISCCKGIAILLMVLVHGGIDYRISAFISMFHMPIFFFFSGFCLNPEYLKQPTLFVRKKINGLYIPYIKWMILFILLHNFFCKIKILNVQNVGYYSYDQIFEKILRTIFTFVGDEQLLGGFWFLRELFWGALFSFFMLKYIENKYVVLFLSMIAALLCHITSWYLPMFGIGYTSFMASCYFVSGFIFKQLDVKPLSPIFIFFSCIIVAIGSFFWNFDAVKKSTLLVVPYYLTAIIGVWLTYSICKLQYFPSNKFLTYIGNNTMPILTWHFLSFKLVSALFIILFQLPWEQLGEFPYMNVYAHQGGWVLYFIIGVFIPLLLNHYINKIGVTIKVQ